jgi:hypothetical protein
VECFSTFLKVAYAFEMSSGTGWIPLSETFQPRQTTRGEAEMCERPKFLLYAKMKMMCNPSIKGSTSFIRNIYFSSFLTFTDLLTFSAECLGYI